MCIIIVMIINLGFKYSSNVHFVCQEKVSRIKATYEHLAKKNEIYRRGRVRKCGCGYLAVTLRDLDQHRRSGFTKYDGRSGFSCNRMIWCCYCNDGVPYTVLKFSKHMVDVHNLKSRLSFPVMNQCPFCTYSWQTSAKTLSHIRSCRALFKPELNLHIPPGMFDLDLPLQSSIRTCQPRSSWHRPQNVTCVTASISNAATWSAAPSAVFSPWRSHRFLSSTVAPSPATIAMEHAVRATGFPAASLNVSSTVVPHSATIPTEHAIRGTAGFPAAGVSVPLWRDYSAPAFLPGVPIPVMSNTITSFLPNMTSAYSAVQWQNRNLTSPAVASGYALNYFQHAIRNQASFDRQVSEAISQVFGAAAARNNIPRSQTVGHAVTTSASVSAFPVRSVGTSLQSSAHVASQSRVSAAAPSSSKKASDHSPAVVLNRLSVSACEVCGSVFDELAPMCRHLLGAHGITVSVKDCCLNNPNKPERCMRCSLRFFSKKGLVRHTQFVHRMSAEHTCLRCSETDIADIIEHFQVKHSVTLRTMVDYRVCYLCKLNFETVAEIERHVVLKHADIFPSRSHFREMLRASLHPAKMTPPVNVLKNGVGFSNHREPVPGETRKRRHSVIEIAENTSESVNFDITNKEQGRESSVVVDLTSNGAILENEPVKKKARTSGSVSTGAINSSTPDMNTAQSMTRNKAWEEHLESGLEKAPVLGTVSHIPKKQPLRSSPLSKKKAASGNNAAERLSGILDVSVCLVPLKSAHDTQLSVVPRTKESIKTPVSTANKPSDTQDVSVRLESLKSVHNAASSQTKGSLVSLISSSSKPPCSPDISPVSSLDSKETSVEKVKGHKKKVRASGRVSTGGVNSSAPDVNAAQSKPRGKAGEEHSESEVAKAPVLGTVSHKRKNDRAVSPPRPLSKKRKVSHNAADESSDAQNIADHLEPMKSVHNERLSIVPQTKRSMESLSKPALDTKVSEKDKSRYRFASQLYKSLCLILSFK